MKKSIFNHYFRGPEKFYVYNAFSNALAEFPDGVAENFINNDEEYIDLLDDTVKKDMLYGGIIIENQFDELKQLQIDMYNAKFGNNSLGITIAPTLDCNFNCPYCFERGSRKRGNITDSVMDGIVSFVKQNVQNLKVLSISWYGGEPLLAMDKINAISSELIDICDKNNINYRSGITTNGYLLDNYTFKTLVDLKIQSIQIPLDGDVHYHDITRRHVNGAVTFDKIIYNLKNLKDLYDTKHSILPNIALRLNSTRKNYQSMINVLDLLYKEEILNYVYPYVARVFDNNDTENKYTLTENEFSEFERKFITTLENVYGKQVEFSYFYPNRITSACTCDKFNSFVIDPLGNLCKCWEEIGKSSAIIGNINHVGEDRRNNNNYYEYLLFNPLSNNQCKKCNFLPICMGGHCPLRRREKKNLSCEEQKKKLVEKLLFSFNRLGITNVEYISEKS